MTYPRLLSVTDKVDGQGGQSVRFLQNNGNCNAKLAIDYGLTTNGINGLIDRCQIILNGGAHYGTH